MTPSSVRWARDGALRAFLHLALVRPLFLLSAGGLAAALAVAQAVPAWVEADIETAAMDQLRLAVVIGQAVLVAGGVLAAGVLSARLRRSHAGLVTAKGETERLVASLAAAHEPEEIVRIAEQHLQTSIDADFAALYLLRGQELERQGATAAEAPPAALALASLPLLRGVMASGPVALVRPPERWEFDQLAGAPLWSVAAAPFALRPEVTGVLLAGRTFGRPFRAEDVQGLQTVVAFALFALDNALAHRELQQRYRRAESWALQDPLTGLANYRAFHDRLEAELTLAAREGLPCALLVADIDQLQRVNERWGLAEGDRRLRQTARLLAREGRRGDLVARCGGDEFGLILRGIPLADAISRASRLCRRARTAAPSGPDGSDALDGLSVGVAVFPDHGSSKEELLAAAERAVAHAGREGGGRVSWPELCAATTQARR